MNSLEAYYFISYFNNGFIVQVIFETKKPIMEFTYMAIYQICYCYLWSQKHFLILFPRHMQ